MKKKILSLLVAFIAAGALSGCGKPPSSGGTKETEKCGNGTVDAGEKCDKKIAAGEPGACPTTETCQDDSKELSGEADKCTAECVAPKCGNGDVDAGETCDIKGKGDQKCLKKPACEAKAGSDGNHRWIFSGKYSECTAKCEEVEADCNDTAKDGFCPEKCTKATDKDCHSFWDECESDTDCPPSAPSCLPLVSVLNTSGETVKRCSVKCDIQTASKCDSLQIEGSSLTGAVCLPDVHRMIAERKKGLGFCSPKCSVDADCRVDGFVCNDVSITPPAILACVYQPEVETNPAQLTKPCDPSDASACTGGTCVAKYYDATGPDSGFCTTLCGRSTPNGLFCSRDVTTPTAPTCQLFQVTSAAKTQYVCFAGCNDDSDCVAGKEYCAKVVGEVHGTCRLIPKSECSDKTECQDSPAGITEGLDCVDNLMPQAPATKFCVAPGSGTVPVGTPLTGSQTVKDCQANTNRAVLFGRACSQNCAGPIGAACPTGSACAYFNSETGYCLKDCEADPSVCPSGTECSLAVGGVTVCIPN